MWQVSNEMDIRIFRGPMTVEQAARFLKAGSLGIKEGNPEMKTANGSSRHSFPKVIEYLITPA